MSQPIPVKKDRIKPYAGAGEYFYSGSVDNSVAIDMTDLHSYLNLSSITDQKNLIDFNNFNGVTFPAGKVGNCANFVSASLQFLDYEGSIFDINTNPDLTFHCWVKLTTKQAASAYIFSKTADGADIDFELLYTGSSTDSFKFRVSDPSLNVINCTAVAGADFPTFSAGDWLFILAEYNHTTKTGNLYINNVLAKTNTNVALTALNNDSSILALGARGDRALAGLLNGSIDEFAMWTRLLTSDEKNYIYNNGNGLSLL